MESSELVQNFLNSEDAKAYDPQSYLIEPSKKTTIPNVFRNPDCPIELTPGKKLIIDIFGPSGVGKDTLTRLPDIADIRIATSRPRRIGEAETAYVWMDDNHEEENQEAYYKRLSEQYGLVSHAVENGILYGVPQDGLDYVRDADVLTIRMSARSIDMLKANLGDKYNIVSLMVVPENFESLVPSIIQRGNVDKRLNEVIENMKLGKQHANYFLLNKHISGSDEEVESQIEAGKKSFSNLVESLRSPNPVLG